MAWSLRHKQIFAQNKYASKMSLDVESHMISFITNQIYLLQHSYATLKSAYNIDHRERSIIIMRDNCETSLQFELFQFSSFTYMKQTTTTTTTYFFLFFRLFNTVDSE